jgi:aerobic-type carbon monoxide dehydrogenase small subunit (CoxS/CutS family)
MLIQGKSQMKSNTVTTLNIPKEDLELLQNTFSKITEVPTGYYTRKQIQEITKCSKPACLLKLSKLKKAKRVLTIQGFARDKNNHPISTTFYKILK